MPAEDSLSVRRLDAVQLAELYVLTLPPGLGLPSLYQRLWHGQRGYRVVGFLDLGDGRGASVIATRLEAAAGG